MTKELMEKVRETKTVEELLALLKENNIVCTEEQAQEMFDRSHDNSLSDEELENAVGGGSWTFTIHDEEAICPVCKALFFEDYGYARDNPTGPHYCPVCKTKWVGPRMSNIESMEQLLQEKAAVEAKK